MTLTTKYPSALKWANKIINLFLPTTCAGCGTLGPMICSNCKSKFSWVLEPICNRCGLPLLHPANACGKCLSSDFNLHQVRSALIYREPVITIIHQMKYSGLFALTKILGQIMVESWPEWDIPPDIIIPIPLHPKRQKSRGYNQSALLATYLAKGLTIQVNVNDLARVKNTVPQVGLSPAKRRENVDDAFQSNSEPIKGKHILLVDDVFTTGATMKAACKSLRSAGAVTVSAYCLARTG